MIIEIIKKIPIAIPIFTFFNIIIVKIIEYVSLIADCILLSKITTFIFNTKTPFYYNYWLIYLVLAIIISMLLGLLKEYSVLKTFICIGINLLSFIIMFIFIVNRM